jgi:hypothetical protein
MERRIIVSVNVNLRPFLFGLIAATAILHGAGPGRAQVTEVVVGITPRCPYGFPGCWAGAKEAMEHLDDVLIVASTPDSFNCTARVGLKHAGLPDLVKWPKQFNSMVGGAHSFRGVEVTVMASVVKKDGQLILKTPGLKQEITLAPLQKKLQWNFKKNTPRQPEPDERKAYRKLAAKKKKAKADDVQVEVTGPLRQMDNGIVLEVREFFLISPQANPRQRD